LHARELGFFAYGYGFDIDEQPTTNLICEQIRAKRAVQIGSETELLLYPSSGLPLSMNLSAITVGFSQRAFMATGSTRCSRSR
jgi:hypothetical protein